LTLVLTELTSAGIAMAADSAISFMTPKGTIRVNAKRWKKLLKIPKITAAISYWGFVGSITQMEFDRYLDRLIERESAYEDLPTFADYLATSLNASSKDVPLSRGHEVGIHVAGYHPWDDGISRPHFFHVHNGHGEYQTRITHDLNSCTIVSRAPEAGRGMDK
jgi:hypothetical protein